MGHWLEHFFGLDNLSGPFYGFWSGAGSDITELALIGGIIGLLRKHNCHQRWCWRFGHHELTDPSTGLTYQLCRRHHPDHPGHKLLTAAAIERIHHRHREHSTSGLGRADTPC